MSYLLFVWSSLNSSLIESKNLLFPQKIIALITEKLWKKIRNVSIRDIIINVAAINITIFYF